jgi:CheY-like chemotaxis protein
MERVLVVDDSADQLLMVESVLQKSGYETATATDGAEALAAIEQQCPDLVVTDLKMPNMNGLELVEKLRDAYPTLPVILMTAYGSGEIAMEALQRGAASYIPKRLIREHMGDTLEQILELTRDRRERERLLVSLVESDLRYVMSTDLSLVPPMVNHVTQIIKARVPDLRANDLMRMGLALQEALLNALYHGNLEVSSDIREVSGSEYLRVAQERSNVAPYSDRKVRLQVHVDGEAIRMIIEDEGQGFDLEQVPDPNDPENLLKASGRGLHLIGTIMDQVIHSNGGSTVELIKRTDKTDD